MEKLRATDDLLVNVLVKRTTSVISDIDLIDVDDKTFAVVSIGEYPVKPVVCKGRYFKRMDKNKNTSKVYIITGNPKREERWDYPMDALREIVINMIVHRDDRSANDSTIKVFDDRIKFFNPGALLDDLTIEKIKTGNYKSHLRNKQIATTFKELEPIEKYGSGVRWVIGTFVACGLPEPVFETTQGGMAVTVFKQTDQQTPEIMAGGVNEGVNGLFALKEVTIQRLQKIYGN